MKQCFIYNRETLGSVLFMYVSSSLITVSRNKIGGIIADLSDIKGIVKEYSEQFGIV